MLYFYSFSIFVCEQVWEHTWGVQDRTYINWVIPVGWLVGRYLTGVNSELHIGEFILASESILVFCLFDQYL